MNRTLYALLTTIFILGLFICISEKVSDAEEKKLDRLIVYGKDFAFSVKEPEGWVADTSNAIKLNANIIFYETGETFQTAKVFIFVRVNDKSEEQVEKDLEWDMEQYLKRYPRVQFRDIPISHPSYKTYSKLFYVQDNFYEYVTYINPGQGKPLTLSSAMNVQKIEALKETFAAYKEVTETLILWRP